MSETGLRRCAVVVDTQNIRGQVRRVLGVSALPTAAGVRAAMRYYGFDAVEILAGVATGSTSARPDPVLQPSLDYNRRYADQLREGGAQVLDGVLVSRGRMEEKKVDVLLALAIAGLVERLRTSTRPPFDCIVLLSEDMDLVPASQYAATRGVPTFAAANDKVFERPEQRDWLILDEQALALMVERDPTDTFGTTARRRIANFAWTGAQATSLWRSPRAQAAGTVDLFNNGGLLGRWVTDSSVKHAQRFKLGPVAVSINREFPCLQLGSEPAEGPFAGVERAVVSHWVSPTRVTVKLSSGEWATLVASPGTLLRGQTVAVLRVEQGRAKPATYLLGHLEDRRPPDTWTSPGRTAMVVVGQDAREGWLRTTLLDGTGQVLVHRSALTHAEAGTRLMVAVSGRDGSTGLPQAMPLTCCLPPHRPFG